MNATITFTTIYASAMLYWHRQIARKKSRHLS